MSFTYQLVDENVVKRWSSVKDEVRSSVKDARILF